MTSDPCSCELLPPGEVLLTFTAPLHLAHHGQRVGQKVRQASVEVHRRQAALEALFGVHQLGQVFVHVLGYASNVQVTLGRERWEKEVTSGNRAHTRLYHNIAGLVALGHV